MGDIHSSRDYAGFSTFQEVLLYEGMVVVIRLIDLLGQPGDSETKLQELGRDKVSNRGLHTGIVWKGGEYYLMCTCSVD